MPFQTLISCQITLGGLNSSRLSQPAWAPSQGAGLSKSTRTHQNINKNATQSHTHISLHISHHNSRVTQLQKGRRARLPAIKHFFFVKRRRVWPRTLQHILVIRFLIGHQKKKKLEWWTNLIFIECFFFFSNKFYDNCVISLCQTNCLEM